MVFLPICRQSLQKIYKWHSPAGIFSIAPDYVKGMNKLKKIWKHKKSPEKKLRTFTSG